MDSHLILIYKTLGPLDSVPFDGAIYSIQVSIPNHSHNWVSWETSLSQWHTDPEVRPWPISPKIRRTHSDEDPPAWSRFHDSSALSKPYRGLLRSNVSIPTKLHRDGTQPTATLRQSAQPLQTHILLAGPRQKKRILPFFFATCTLPASLRFPDKTDIPYIQYRTSRAPPLLSHSPPNFRLPGEHGPIKKPSIAGNSVE